MKKVLYFLFLFLPILYSCSQSNDPESYNDWYNHGELVVLAIIWLGYHIYRIFKEGDL